VQWHDADMVRAVRACGSVTSLGTYSKTLAGATSDIYTHRHDAGYSSARRNTQRSTAAACTTMRSSYLGTVLGTISPVRIVCERTLNCHRNVSFTLCPETTRACRRVQAAGQQCGKAKRFLDAATRLHADVSSYMHSTHVCAICIAVHSRLFCRKDTMFKLAVTTLAVLGAAGPHAGAILLEQVMLPRFGEISSCRRRIACPHAQRPAKGCVAVPFAQATRTLH
jgi:hypothetical protein